jgi:hypothetical protein
MARVSPAGGPARRESRQPGQDLRRCGRQAPHVLVPRLAPKDPGTVRYAFDLDYNGTPGNPDDDIDVPDSFRIVRSSTGNSDLTGRDFCADLVQFTTP